MERAAMSAALLILALAAPAPDWFRVYQYALKAATLRGCSECQGEPDDVCEVRAGAQSRALDEYAAQRPPAPGRVSLLRSKAETDCAPPAKVLFSPKGGVELTAIRMARAAPSAALLDRLAPRFALQGWPRTPQRRKGTEPRAALPERTALRVSLLCWGSERAWPAAELGPGSTCEWWLLPVGADGEPDVAGPSFPLLAQRNKWPEQFHFGDARWSRAFDRAAPLEESTLLGEETPKPEPPAAPAPLPPPAAPPPVAARCGAEARQRTALLDRFDQWEQQIVGPRRSLDRASWTLDAAVWSGHCPEMDVLRSVLEQQLGCAVGQEGRCIGAAGAEAPR
jgi:hypothetical protein